MDNFDLIGSLSSYASDNDMHYLSGENAYQNYEASQNTYDDGQLVLSADFDASVNFSSGFAVGSITYIGVLALGRKFDEVDTGSDLDETFYQKYQRRLKDLMTLLVTHIAAFACDNKLQVTNCQFRMDLNKFDTNIDFIAASITFVQ
jgi:hypothetical protein